MSTEPNFADPDHPMPAPVSRGRRDQCIFSSKDTPMEKFTTNFIALAKKNIFRDKQLCLSEFSSFEEVRPFWEELNRTYKDGELTLDWKSHALIYNNFYRDRNAALKIFVAFEGQRCIGIFPMMWLDNDPIDPPRLTLSDDFIIAREYFCPPEKLQQTIEFLPPHYADDLSCFYQPEETDLFSRSPGGIVDLMDSEEAYFQSLRKKARHTLKRTLALNADLRIESDTRVRQDEIQSVLQHQLDYWIQKSSVISSAYVEYSRKKVMTDLILMDRAAEMGKLIAHYYYEGRTLVAVNFSVRREKDRVDDYLCLRDCREHQGWRGLGIFAILTNMNFCRRNGIRWYDLSACVKDYKKKFMNKESFFYYKAYPEYPIVRDPGIKEGEVFYTDGNDLAVRNAQV
jgi:hypothetical protein